MALCFEAINGFWEDIYFAEALDLDRAPSEGILRQRMDRFASDYQSVVETAAIDFLIQSQAQITPLDNGLIPLDCDATPFDNSQSNQEGVSRAYKGMDGYTPMAAYLGQEGDCLELELRAGSQHCQNGTPEFLQRVLGRTRQVTAASVLLRLDGGNDAIENIAVVEAHNQQDESAAPALPDQMEPTPGKPRTVARLRRGARRLEHPASGQAGRTVRRDRNAQP